MQERIVRERSGAFATNAKNTTPTNRKRENFQKKFASKLSNPTMPAQADAVLEKCLVSVRLMCITGLKKTAQNLKSDYHILELDELYWFVKKKPKTETRENTYVMTMVSREPRQIVGYDVARDKSPKRIQAMVDTAPCAEKYYSDGYLGYIDVVYPGKYKRNVRDKSDTFTVEGVNADLRHYIPILRRRSRCFPRKLETLRAVLALFVDAYNAFGLAKMNFRKNRNPKSRELPFSVLDFL